MSTSLITFDAAAKTITSVNEKMGCTTVRLLTASEFKKANGVKGTEAKRKYAEYILEHGAVNTGELAGAMARGELLVRGVSDYRKAGTMRVNFIRKSHVKVPEEKPVVQAAPEVLAERDAAVAKAEKLAALLKSLGATDDQITAAAV